MSVRSDLAAVLTPLLPPEWKVIPYERDIDPPSTTVLMLRQSRIVWLSEAGRLAAVITLSVISNRTDNLENAEDDLDTQVNLLLDALLRVVSARLDDAEKIRFGKVGYPAWNINLTIPLERKL